MDSEKEVVETEATKDEKQESAEVVAPPTVTTVEEAKESESLGTAVEECDPHTAQSSQDGGINSEKTALESEETCENTTMSQEDDEIMEEDEEEESAIEEQTTPGSIIGSSARGVPKRGRGSRGGRMGRGSRGSRRARLPRDSNAPKQPVNGYVRYLNENRERIRRENPSVPFTEVTKLLALGWSKLPQEEKQKYLEEAEREREIYAKDMEEYMKSDAYKEYVDRQKEANKAKKVSPIHGPARMPTQPLHVLQQCNGAPMLNGRGMVSPFLPSYLQRQLDEDTSLTISVFTDDFLEHGRERDKELRHLRKLDNQHQEEVKTLREHIKSMKGAVEKLEAETEQSRQNHRILETYLNKLRTGLVDKFADLILPNGTGPPTLDSIDAYMEQLHQLLKDNNPKHSEIISTARTIIGKIDCHV